MHGTMSLKKMVTLRNPTLTTQFYILHTIYLRFMLISEQSAIISLYNIWFFITETACFSSRHERKVKQFLCRPWGFQVVEVLRFHENRYIEGDKVVSPRHRPPLPPSKKFLALISVTDWVDTRAMVWPAKLRQRKTRMTPSGNEPV